MKKVIATRTIYMLALYTIFSFIIPQTLLAYEKEINSLSISMAEKISKAGKVRVAVVDFTDLQGNVTELGRFIAEEFSVSLAGAGKGFKVIDRVHLKSIIREHKLSATGLIDPGTARQLGKIAGVEALVTGTITPFGESVRLSIKILDTATAEVIDANRGNIPKTKAIDELLARGIESTTIIVEGSSTIPLPIYTTEKIVEFESFFFKPIRCKRNGSKLICTISFINNGNEQRTLNIIVRHWSVPFSRLIDNRGNQYPVTYIQIGDQKNDHGINQIFIQKLPINVNFLAEGIDPNSTHISLGISIADFKNLVMIRNIPIIK